MSRRKLLWRKMLLHSEAGRKPGGLQQLLFLSSMQAAVVVTGMSLQLLFLHTINQQELASSFSFGNPAITWFHFSIAQLFSRLCFTTRCLSDLMKNANITLCVHHHNDNINKNYGRHRSKFKRQNICQPSCAITVDKITVSKLSGSFKYRYCTNCRREFHSTSEDKYNHLGESQKRLVFYKAYDLGCSIFLFCIMVQMLYNSFLKDGEQ